MQLYDLVYNVDTLTLFCGLKGHSQIQSEAGYNSNLELRLSSRAPKTPPIPFLLLPNGEKQRHALESDFSRHVIKHKSCNSLNWKL